MKTTSIVYRILAAYIRSTVGPCAFVIDKYAGLAYFFDNRYPGRGFGELGRVYQAQARYLRNTPVRTHIARTTSFWRGVLRRDPTQVAYAVRMVMEGMAP